MKIIRKLATVKLQKGSLSTTTVFVAYWGLLCPLHQNDVLKKNGTDATSNSDDPVSQVMMLNECHD